MPTACGFDGSPLESDYYCRRRKAEVPDEDSACWNCLDMPEEEWDPTWADPFDGDDDPLLLALS